MVHTLHPVSYIKTCLQLFGTIVRPEEILSLTKYKLRTQQLWQQMFDEDIDASYLYHRYHPPPQNKVCKAQTKQTKIHMRRAQSVNEIIYE